MKEVLDKGAVREIQLDQASLFIIHNSSYPFASILITSKFSKSLRIGLQQFNKLFMEKFSKSLETANYTSQFKGASEIIHEVFEFVPEYK